MLLKAESPEQFRGQRGLRGSQRKLVDQLHLVVGQTSCQGHSRGRLQSLSRHPPAEIPGPLGKDVTTATPGATAPTAGTGVARTLLTVELLGRPSHLATVLRALRTLPLIGLVHDDCIVQQLLADRWRQLGGIDLVGPDLFARHVVDGKIHFAPAFFLVVGVAGPPTRLITFV